MNCIYSLDTHVLEVGQIVVFYRDSLLQNENSVIIYFIYPDVALNLNDSLSPVKQKTFFILFFSFLL